MSSTGHTTVIEVVRSRGPSRRRGVSAARSEAQRVGRWRRRAGQSPGRDQRGLEQPDQRRPGESSEPPLGFLGSNASRATAVPRSESGRVQTPNGELEGPRLRAFSVSGRRGSNPRYLAWEVIRGFPWGPSRLRTRKLQRSHFRGLAPRSTAPRDTYVTRDHAAARPVAPDKAQGGTGREVFRCTSLTSGLKPAIAPCNAARENAPS